MNVIVAQPPNIDELRKHFPVSDSVIFTWGDAIFNPYDVRITRELRAHEEVHSARQGKTPERWWDLYVEDPSFRFAEELLAHKAEYQAYCKRHGSRKDRQRFLKSVATRLASPLYGELMAPRDAMLAIQTR